MLTHAAADGRLINTRPFRLLREAVRRQPHAWVLGAIVLTSLLFELHVARECSLWIDELNTYLMVVRKAWPAVLAGASREHPPLFFILVKLVTDLFGVSEMSLRALSLGFGCVLLVAVYWLCLELGVEAKRALAVVATVALAPFFVRHSAEARQYALFPACGTLALASALRYLREPKRLGFLAGFALSASATAATHYFGLAYGCALLGLVLLGTLPHWKALDLTRRQLLTAGAIVLALAGVFAWILARAVALAHFYAQPGFGDDTLPWRDLLRMMAYEFSFISSAAWVTYLEIPFAAIGLVLLGRRLRGLTRAAPVAMAFAPCMLSLFISSGHFVAPRYLAPSWVLYHLGAMTTLLALGDTLRRLWTERRPELGAMFAGLPLATAVAVRLAEYPKEYGTGEEDYRAFQQYFRAHFQADTALVTFKGLFGERIMGIAYPVGSNPIWLEKFRPRRGISRYVVAEIQVSSPDRQADLERLVEEHFGLSRAAWRALPVLDVPHSKYQTAVVARVLVLNDAEVAAPPRRPKHGRHRAPAAEPADEP